MNLPKSLTHRPVYSRQLPPPVSITTLQLSLATEVTNLHQISEKWCYVGPNCKPDHLICPLHLIFSFINLKIQNTLLFPISKRQWQVRRFELVGYNDYWASNTTCKSKIDFPLLKQGLFWFSPDSQSIAQKVKSQYNLIHHSFSLSFPSSFTIFLLLSVIIPKFSPQFLGSFNWILEVWGIALVLWCIKEGRRQKRRYLIEKNGSEEAKKKAQHGVGSSKMKGREGQKNCCRQQKWMIEFASAEIIRTRRGGGAQWLSILVN